LSVSRAVLRTVPPEPAPISSRPDRTQNTLAAIEKFLALRLIVLGALQLLAASCSDAVRQHADCWLRTPSGNVPSDFISRTALANLLHANISSLAKTVYSPQANLVLNNL
jgi:hypothetical protein